MFQLFRFFLKQKLILIVKTNLIIGSFIFAIKLLSPKFLSESSTFITFSTIIFYVSIVLNLEKNSNISTQLSWIYQLPLKRKNVFFLDFTFKAFSFLLNQIFLTLPLIGLIYFLNFKNLKMNTFLQNDPTIFPSEVSTLLKTFNKNSNFYTIESFFILSTFFFLTYNFLLLSPRATPLNFSKNTFFSNELFNLKKISFFKILTIICFLINFSFFIYGIYSFYLLTITQFILFGFILSHLQIQKFNFFKYDAKKFLGFHAFLTLAFIATFSHLIYKGYHSSDFYEKSQAYSYLGSFAPSSLKVEELKNYFLNQKEKFNPTDLAQILEQNHLTKTILSLDKDWNFFSQNLKLKKSSKEVHELLQFFEVKSLNDFQFNEIFNAFAYVNDGQPFDADYLYLAQFPQTLDTLKKFLNSNKRIYHKMALIYGSYQLESMLSDEIKKSIPKMHPFEQRLALKTLSTYEKKPIGLLNWNTLFSSERETKLNKVIGRSVASFFERSDLKKGCDSLTLPDLSKPLSLEQMDNISSCMRYRARNADLSLKLSIENIGWIYQKLDLNDAKILKKVYSLTTSK